MGRILRITLAEDVIYPLDLKMVGAGKIFIRNGSAFDVRIGYTRIDVDSTSGVNFYTLIAGSERILDLSPSVGYLEQDQAMFWNSPDGDAVMEIWVANPL